MTNNSLRQTIQQLEQALTALRSTESTAVPEPVAFTIPAEPAKVFPAKN